jgi:hypothetical protein
LSLVALVPNNTDTSLAVIVGVVAIVGLVYSIVILASVIRSSAADAADRLGYGAGPFAAYAAMLAAAGLLWTHAKFGPKLLAGALVLLLLVNIRNAWDLTLTFARHRPDGNSHS